jgi:hypothetical protein
MTAGLPRSRLNQSGKSLEVVILAPGVGRNNNSGTLTLPPFGECRGELCGFALLSREPFFPNVTRLT